jgi:14-3-3 protein epsilon
MSKGYEKNVYLAMLAEQCNRFEDMIEFLEGMLKGRSEDLNSDERNLLSIAYKNAVSTRRAALRTVMAYEIKEKKKENSTFLPYIIEYRGKLENELTKMCEKVIQVIDTILLGRAADAEAKVFYLKMKGDYNRYIAEYAQNELKQKVSDASLKAYEEASNNSKELSAVHPLVLGLLLNFSVFYYEVIGDHEKACQIAKETLEKADKELPADEDDEIHRDAISIVNLLRENLEMWRNDEGENN